MPRTSGKKNSLRYLEQTSLFKEVQLQQINDKVGVVCVLCTLPLLAISHLLDYTYVELKLGIKEATNVTYCVTNFKQSLFLQN